MKHLSCVEKEGKTKKRGGCREETQRDKSASAQQGNLRVFDLTRTKIAVFTPSQNAKSRASVSHDEETHTARGAEHFSFFFLLVKIEGTARSPFPTVHHAVRDSDPTRLGTIIVHEFKVPLTPFGNSALRSLFLQTS